MTANEEKMLKMNCQDILLKTERQIKSIHYKLNTVISNGDSHILLAPKVPFKIDVIEQTFIYMKLEAMNQMVPAKFHIDYFSPEKDIRVWASFSNEFPSKDQCDFMLPTPHAWNFKIYPRST